MNLGQTARNGGWVILQWWLLVSFFAYWVRDVTIRLIVGSLALGVAIWWQLALVAVGAGFIGLGIILALSLATGRYAFSGNFI